MNASFESNTNKTHKHIFKQFSPIKIIIIFSFYVSRLLRFYYRSKMQNNSFLNVDHLVEMVQFRD